MVFQVRNGIGSFVEQQVQNGQIRGEPVAVAKDLRVGGPQSERVVGLRLPFGVNELAQVRVEFFHVFTSAFPIVGQR